MIERFKEKGGTACDHLLAGEIISYVYNTKCLGASGQEIKVNIVNVFSITIKMLIF